MKDSGENKTLVKVLYKYSGRYEEVGEEMWCQEYVDTEG
jgi:hypothetical protein